jgi:predicted PurR-regulated permease PerM
VLAYILDPVVDFMERKGMERRGGIVLVFGLGLLLLAFLLATVVPQLVFQIGELVSRMPDHTEALHKRLENWAQWGMGTACAGEFASDEPLGEARSGIAGNVGECDSSGVELGHRRGLAGWRPGLGSWSGCSWFRFMCFYFLLQKRRIAESWTEYLPVQESKVKEELVFVLRSINDSLIVFFRGQVLVALCVGVLTAVGFTLIGLRYALLLGR